MTTYGLSSSQVQHYSELCVKVRDKKALRQLNSNEATMRRKCKYCFPEAICFICTESCKDAFGSHECHSICSVCMEQHIHILSKNVYWDRVVKCPCKSGIRIEVPDDMIPHKHLITSADLSFKRCLIDEGVNFVCNLRCPNCSVVFFDFDACCALHCECGAYFCAFCEEMFENNKKCHDHAIQCGLNPMPGELFVPLDLWRKQQNYSKKYKFLKFINSIKSEVTLLHMSAIIYAFSRHGVHIINNYFKTVLSVVLFVFVSHLSILPLLLLVYVPCISVIWFVL